MNADVWNPEWAFRIYERIALLGYHSLSEFIDGRPMVSLVALARELGPGVAAVQLEAIWFREAERHGRVRHTLGSLLIRCIRRAIPEGWATGDTFDFHLAGGFASWSRLAEHALSEGCRDHVWNRLRSLPAAPGWLPVVPPDELTSSLLAAVEEALAMADDENRDRELTVKSEDRHRE